MGGTTSTATDIATMWEQELARMLGNEIAARVLVGLLILVLALWVAHVLVKTINRVLEHNESSLVNISFFDNVVRALVYGIGVCAILDACFGVDMSTFIAALGIGGIAISLGLQDTLKNLIGGATIMVTRIFRPGDNVTIGGQTGVVQDIGWRQTTLKSRTGELIMVPNANISTANVTLAAPLEKSVVVFVVANDRTLDEVADLIVPAARTAASAFAHVEGEPTVQFSEITEYGARGKVILWVDDGEQINEINDAVARAINGFVR